MSFKLQANREDTSFRLQALGEVRELKLTCSPDAEASGFRRSAKLKASELQG